jgi:hypothetical protein
MIGVFSGWAARARWDRMIGDYSLMHVTDYYRSDIYPPGLVKLLVYSMFTDKSNESTKGHRANENQEGIIAYIMSLYSKLAYLQMLSLPPLRSICVCQVELGDLQETMRRDLAGEGVPFACRPAVCDL